MNPLARVLAEVEDPSLFTAASNHYCDVIALGDRAQSEASRLVEFLRSKGKIGALPYTVQLSVLELESFVQEWTKLRSET